jgi:L-ascorbate metabolism protein UlaG (beta-lactamase superfamily)
MEGISRRIYPPPFAPNEIQKVDYVLCTHNHGDHLNLQTLAPLAKANPHARFVVPAPNKNLLAEAGISGGRVLAARAGESLGLLPPSGLSGDPEPVTVYPVPAVHTRYIQDEGEKDENGDYTSLGFVIKGEGVSMYHSGDTWVTPGLVRALKELGPLDLAMLPINGTDWERTAENCIGNVGYLDAVKLAGAVPFDLVIPSHYDMMANNSENPARFAEAMYALCPEKRFHISALGERFIYRKD